MNKNKKTWIAFICLMCCMICMQMSVLASELDDDSSNHGTDTVDCEVSLVSWKRRIYDLTFDVQGIDTDAKAIRVYAGNNYHFTDDDGAILSEDDLIDENGSVTTNVNGGRISRDQNGWYVIWENPNYGKMLEQHIFVQANLEFSGGNNQRLSVSGLSGLYASKDDSKPVLEMDFDEIIVNVASEIDISDTEVPVMVGMNVDNSTFLSAAAIKITAVYGELRELPIQIQWYRIIENDDGTKTESMIGERMTQAPFCIPESEYDRISIDNTEYLIKAYYNGEVSTAEAKKNTDGYENIVSDTESIDEAAYKTELVKGKIDVAVQLERLPYNNESSSTDFSYRLYRFEQQNQVITGNTPYKVYTVTFEKGGSQLVQHLSIDDLEAGWYTLIPETSYSDFVEKTDERSDNRGEDGRRGSSAGVDFCIGQIVDNKYSWEMIRYQGQDTEASVGDNFFKITYKYKEALYGVTYEMNAPKGTSVSGRVPSDSSKYREGSMVTVQSGENLRIDGWQFVGWSLEAGDGEYFIGDVLYSDQSVHGIPVDRRVPMTDGGLTLYAKWIPIYSVVYHGNTYTDGTLPVDTKGTVTKGTNLYYSGDYITVQAPGNIKKQDSDGVKYEFVGWTLNQDGSGIYYFEGDRIFIESSDVNLYAQWRAVGTDKFAVNYMTVIPKGASLLGEAPEDSDKYAPGNVVKVMGKGTMSVLHYRFAGWSLTSNEDGLYVEGEEIFGTNDLGETVTREETVMKEQGLSFYTRWIPLYQVIYHSDIEEGLPQDTNEYEAKDSVMILDGDGIERPGYVFDGWNTAEDGSGINYKAGTDIEMPDENLELYAQWKIITEVENEPETKDLDESSDGIGTVPLILLSIIGSACITACVVYMLMKRK